jgi:4,5-dihydroxyphthalate decarboxylase
VTTGIWARGILQSEYGVDLGKITWAPTDDEHVAEYRAPGNVDYARRGQALPELLATGQLAAAVGDIKVDSPDVKPLIPDARNAGYAYFKKTGIYPINHGVVVKDSVLAEAPWVAEELFAAFAAAKRTYLSTLDKGGKRSPADEQAAALGGVVGGDPFPFGIEANRKALEAIAQFAVDQRVTHKKYRPEDLFAASTLELA